MQFSQKVCFHLGLKNGGEESVELNFINLDLLRIWNDKMINQLLEDTNNNNIHPSSKEDLIQKLYDKNILEVTEYTIEDSHGVIHIHIRLGLTLNAHILGGGATLGLVTLLMESSSPTNDFQSIHKYMDSSTGEFLSHDRNGASEALYRKGLEHFHEKRYLEAYEYFNNAANLCAGSYPNEEHFRRWRDETEGILHLDQRAAGILERGVRLINEGRFSQAKETFTQGCHECIQSYTWVQTFLEKRLEADERIQELEALEKEQNLKAQDLYSQGLQCYECGDLKNASLHFTQAYNECTPNSDHRSLYLNKKTEAAEAFKNSEKDWIINEKAEATFSRGLDLLAQGKFEEASQALAAALSDCTDNYENKHAIKLQLKKAQKRAKKLQDKNELAEELFAQLTELLAHEKYQEGATLVDQVSNRVNNNNDYSPSLPFKILKKLEQREDLQTQSQVQALLLFFKGKLLLQKVLQSPTPENFTDLQVVQKLFKKCVKLHPLPEYTLSLKRLDLNLQGLTLLTSSSRLRSQARVQSLNKNYSKAQQLLKAAVEKLEEAVEVFGEGETSDEDGQMNYYFQGLALEAKSLLIPALRKEWEETKELDKGLLVSFFSRVFPSLTINIR